MHFSAIVAMLAGFGDLGDPVVPPPRGVSGEIVTVYAYWIREDVFCSL